VLLRSCRTAVTGDTNDTRPPPWNRRAAVPVVSQSLLFPSGTARSRPGHPLHTTWMPRSCRSRAC